MLDLAIKYETKLQELFSNVSLDEKYMFYHGMSYREKYKADEGTWNKHEFVSLDANKNVIGYISYSVDRDSFMAFGLCIINFSDNKITFGKDVAIAIDEIFTKFKFRKLNYSVYIGNPIERTYDKMTLKYGGRIVGVRKKNTRLLDGNLYDFKMYEIFREDYLKNNVKLHK